MPISDEEIVETTLKLVGPDRSVAPRDIAQKLIPAEEDGKDWRSLLPRIKKLATVLAGDGQLQILRKGKPVSPAGLKGVYRIAGPDYQKVKDTANDQASDA
ncbi:hypothetical protein GCM10017044_02900 [Kordiimonas sediminis]|uniref:DUF3253 domain-containing protein n=1 Tax=Kordiimonas sediminis TaxID=1735581 RepID=A0A919AK24_9PROT|nr:DUF3253 domain-containing protein [Kordiimonas sediminis]GHF12375.1 hypothetical protein GCM10017044_02900 [Kordiimonas sediminis]